MLGSKLQDNHKKLRNVSKLQKEIPVPNMFALLFISNETNQLFLSYKYIFESCQIDEAREAMLSNIHRFLARDSMICLQVHSHVIT